jgi:PST family polysaccharide transporter
MAMAKPRGRELMSVSKRFVVSSAFMILGTGANNIVALAVFVIIARLVDPATIGIVFFALIFVELARITVFGGLPDAIIQRSEWDERTASTCFFATLGIAVFMMATIVLGVAPLLEAYYHPDAGPVAVALAVTLLVDGMRAIHEAKLKRAFSYKMLAARASISTLFAGAVGVAMAYSGHGIWALVAHRVTASAILTALTWSAARWLPALVFSWSDLKPLLSFAANLTPARVLTFFNVKIPELTVGIFFGPAAAGLYRIGNRALEALGQIVLAPVRETALSAFSRLPDNRAIGFAYMRATRVMAFIACPIYLGAAALAPDIILLLFGPKWADSGVIMALLALAVGGNVFTYFLPQALTAMAQTGLVLRTSIFGTITYAVMSLAAVPFGLLAVAVAYSLRSHASVPYWLLILAGKTQLDRKELMASVLPYWLAAAAMAACVFALRFYAWPDAHLLVRIAAGVGAGAAIYASLLLLFGRRHVRTIQAELTPLMPHRIRRFLPPAG